MLTDLITTSTVSGGPNSYSTGPTGNGGTYGGGSSATSYYMFTKPHMVIQVNYSFVLSTYEYGDDTGTVAYTAYVQWYNGSSWQTVPSAYYYYSNGQYHGSQNGNLNTGSVVLTGLSLPNCSGILSYMYTQANNNKNNGTCNTQASMSVPNAYSQIYNDSGLRVESPIHGIVKIGCEPLNSSHKLRTYNSINGGIVGIPLLATSDINASPVRIMADSTIYSLPNETA